MEQMMPKMMEGVNMMDMMPKMMMGMMSRGEKAETPMMSQMMLQMMPEMMPYCLGKVLPGMPEEKRIDFALKIVTSLVEQGCAGMSNEEKADFLAKIAEKVKT